MPTFIHLHSRYSVSSSEYLIRMMRLNESCTQIDTPYPQAKARGMDFVTITDHDTIEGALELVARHPEDSFVSVEVTARFPADECKAHILVYGIDERSAGAAAVHALHRHFQDHGLPAIVTDIGGPQEIVVNGRTGYVLSLADPKAWTQHLLTLMHSKLASPAAWNGKRREIVEYTARESNLEAALSHLMAIDAAAAKHPVSGIPRLKREVA